MAATRPGTISLRRIAIRVGLMLLVVVAGSLLLAILGAPRRMANSAIVGAAVAVCFASVYPPETPHRWRKSAISWAGHFVFFMGASLLMKWWRGV